MLISDIPKLSNHVVLHLAEKEFYGCSRHNIKGFKDIQDAKDHFGKPANKYCRRRVVHLERLTNVYIKNVSEKADLESVLSDYYDEKKFYLIEFMPMTSWLFKYSESLKHQDYGIDLLYKCEIVYASSSKYSFEEEKITQIKKISNDYRPGCQIQDSYLSK